MWYYMYPSIEEVKDFPFYVISIGLHELQPLVEKPNGHEFDQFFYNSSGTGTLEIYNRKYELSEGSAFFIPAHVPHKYYPNDDYWDIRWMVPGGYALNGLYSKLKLDSSNIYILDDESALDVILGKMRRELIQDTENGNVFAAGYVYEFIIQFARLTSLKESIQMGSDTYTGYINTLKDYIEYHFMYDITLKDLCDTVAVTPQHLCKIFHKTIGMRPMEYISYVRIRKAKELLQYTEFSVNDIAHKCGFTNTNYFCRQFKKYEQITPTEYRKGVI